MSVVEHGISYRGHPYVTLSGSQLRYCFRVTRGLYSGIEVRGVDTVIPAADWQVARGRRPNRRVIEVEGFVQGCGADDSAQRTDFESAMAALSADFDPSLAAGTLAVVLQNGSTISIEARTLPGTLEGDDGIPTRLDLSLRLEALGDWEVAGS